MMSRLTSCGIRYAALLPPLPCGSLHPDGLRLVEAFQPERAGAAKAGARLLGERRERGLREGHPAGERQGDPRAGLIRAILLADRLDAEQHSFSTGRSPHKTASES